MGVLISHRTLAPDTAISQGGYSEYLFNGASATFRSTIPRGLISSQNLTPLTSGVMLNQTSGSSLTTTAPATITSASANSNRAYAWVK